MLAGNRNNRGILQSRWDVKSWLGRLPTVEEARPGQCPNCEAASRPAGGALGLWGHGVRDRQQRGPLDPGGPPVIVVVTTRRYQCVACNALITVVPRGVSRWRHYSAAAIGIALALHGVMRETASAVRRQVSPWRIVGASAAGGWASLRRWTRAARESALFSRLGAAAARTLREVAEHAANKLAAHAAPSSRGQPITVQAFLGAIALA